MYTDENNPEEGIDEHGVGVGKHCRSKATEQERMGGSQSTDEGFGFGHQTVPPWPWEES